MVVLSVSAISSLAAPRYAAAAARTSASSRRSLACR